MIKRVFPLLLLAIAAPLGAQMRTSDVPPMSWAERMVPEKLPPLKAPEYADTLDKAKMQIAVGRYRLALQTLRLATDIDPSKRDLLMAQAYRRSGYYAEALAKVDVPALADSPEAIRIKAACLAETGKRKEAIALLQQFVARPDKSPQTHALLGELLESTGQLSAAADAYKWFVTEDCISRWQKDQLSEIESADDLVAIASGLSRYATLTGLYREKPELHQQILAMFIRAYDVLDRRNADAHIAAANFLLTHGNTQDAGADVETAIEINPSHVQAWQIMAEQSLHQKNTADVERSLNAISSVNPDHPAVTMLDAELRLMLRQPDEVQKELEPLIRRDPANAQVLALLASADAMRADANALQERLKRIDTLMPESSLAYVAAAETVISMGQPKWAIPLLTTAIARTPHWNQPRNLLGVVYMLSTNTDQARPFLEQAHELDPFSPENTNYLRLLDVLAKLKTHTSGHFAVRFDPRDEFLADEVLAYMEGNYRRITNNFLHEPSERTFIELMPENEDFSVRATGRPEHATYAVTLGPVITIIAPRNGDKTIGAFDWCDVLRHEFTHTITIEATDGRIPRWFTEGLAVSEQVQPLWNSRVMLLAKTVNAKRLMSLRNIDLAITGHGNPELGYAQGYWICHYITGKYGYDKIIAMLQAYHDGLSTDAVFRRVFGKSADDFDEEFASWAVSQIRKMGLDRASQAVVASMKTEGEQQLKEQNYTQACDTFDKALAICPLDPAIHQRLAGLYLHKSINQPEKAILHLRFIDRDQLRDNRYSLRLSKLYDQLGHPDEAIQYALRANQINAYDAKAREALAATLQKAGRSADAEKESKIAAELKAAEKK